MLFLSTECYKKDTILRPKTLNLKAIQIQSGDYWCSLLAKIWWGHWTDPFSSSPFLEGARDIASLIDHEMVVYPM